MSELLQEFGKSIDTDIAIKDGVEFYKLSKNIKETSDLVLDDSPKTNLPNGEKSLLFHAPASDYGGAYVLISQDDNFETVQQYVRTVLSESAKKNEATPSTRSGNN